MSINLARSIEGVNITHSNSNINQHFEMKDDYCCHHSRTSSSSKRNHYHSNNHVNENHNHNNNNHHKSNHHESIFNLLSNVDIMNDEKNTAIATVIEKANNELNELENENPTLDLLNEIDNTYDTTSSNPMNDQIVELNLSNISSSNNPSTSNKSKIIDDKPINCRTKMQKVMRSPKLHLIVVILVVLDSICVSIELIIDIIITMNEKKELNHQIYNNHSIQNNISSNLIRLFNNTTGTFLNLTSFNSNMSEIRLINVYDGASGGTGPGGASESINNGSALNHNDPNKFFGGYRQKNKTYSTFLLFIIHFEEILKYVGLTILSFFVCEIILKIIFIPRDIIKSKWGVFDAFVVFVSFVLDLILLRNKQLLHTVSGLITLLRLWRITRIINGIVMTMEKKSAEKVQRLVKIINKLKIENEDLKQEISEKDILIQRLTKQNAELIAKQAKT